MKVANMITVREATSSDIRVIVELIRLKAEFDGISDEMLADPRLLERSLFGQDPLATVLIAEMDGCPVGIATYHDHFSTFIARPGIWLDDLFVRDGFRGHGVGEVLIRKLCGIAVAKKCARIEWTVSASNTLGIQFYRRLGADVFESSRFSRLNEGEILRLSQGQEDQKLFVSSL